MEELGVRHLWRLPFAVLERLREFRPGGLHCLIWILSAFEGFEELISGPDHSWHGCISLEKEF